MQITVGQNKNNVMMLLAESQLDYINQSHSFLGVGHTNVSPDGCFGLFRKRLRVTKVGTLSDIERVNEVKTSQLCGKEGGTVIFSTNDWKANFASHYKTIPHINYHHFHRTHNSRQRQSCQSR